MTPPLIAWAAVAPDGTMRESMIRASENEAWACAAGVAFQHANRADRDRAQFAGWHVVQVEIRVKEDGNV